MRRRGKPDINQHAIVSALRHSGAMVLDLKAVGAGCPDIAVLRRGQTYWLEIKQPKQRDRLSDAQKEWHENAMFRGVTVHVVTTEGEALRAIGA